MSIETSSRNRTSLAIFALALALRLAFIAAGVGTQEVPRDDAAQYDTLARSLASGGPYITTDGHRSNRAPAYPFLLAGVYALFGSSWRAGLFAQAFLGSLTCVAAHALGVRLFGREAGAAGGLACAVFPYSIAWCGSLLSEPLCALFTTLSTLALARCSQGARWVASWSFLCALATLTRPNMALLFLLGLPLLLRPFRGAGARGALAAGVFILALMPWTIRNYRIHHRLVPVTTMGGVVLWEGNNPYLAHDPLKRGLYMSLSQMPEGGLARNLPEAEADAVYFRRATRYMRENPLETLGLVGWRCLRLWNIVPGVESRSQRWLGAFSMVMMLVFLAIGLSRAAARRDRAPAVLVVPILAVVLSALIYWADARIRAPADPEILVLAGYGAWFVRTRMKATGSLRDGGLTT